MIVRILKIAALITSFFLLVGISSYLTLTLLIKSEDTVIIPKLVGKNVTYVLEILTDLGLNTKVKSSEYSDIPENHIIVQEPEPGVEIKKGRDVQVIISKGPRNVLMPNVVGLSDQQARIILEENDLSQGTLSLTFSPKVKKDSAIAQTPSPGTMIRRDSSVDLLVSLGRRPVAYQMLDLTGLSIDDAILLIERNNYNFGEIKTVFDKYKPLNVVIDQEPKSGFRAIEGSVVNLIVNRDLGKKKLKNMRSATGVRLFRYRLENGFLKKHIRIRLNCFGVSSDIYNTLLKPGQEAWVFIPMNREATVLLYEDGDLVKTKVYDAW